MERGMTDDAALKAITLGAAQHIGIDNQVGSQANFIFLL